MPHRMDLTGFIGVCHAKINRSLKWWVLNIDKVPSATVILKKNPAPRDQMLQWQTKLLFAGDITIINSISFSALRVLLQQLMDSASIFTVIKYFWHLQVIWKHRSCGHHINFFFFFLWTFMNTPLPPLLQVLAVSQVLKFFTTPLSLGHGQGQATSFNHHHPCKTSSDALHASVYSTPTWI